MAGRDFLHSNDTAATRSSRFIAGRGSHHPTMRQHLIILILGRSRSPPFHLSAKSSSERRGGDEVRGLGSVRWRRGRGVDKEMLNKNTTKRKPHLAAIQSGQARSSPHDHAATALIKVRSCDCCGCGVLLSALTLAGLNPKPQLGPASAVEAPRFPARVLAEPTQRHPLDQRRLLSPRVTRPHHPSRPFPQINLLAGRRRHRSTLVSSRSEFPKLGRVLLFPPRQHKPEARKGMGRGTGGGGGRDVAEIGRRQQCCTKSKGGGEGTAAGVVHS